MRWTFVLRCPDCWRVLRRICGLPARSLDLVEPFAVTVCMECTRIWLRPAVGEVLWVVEEQVTAQGTGPR